MMIDHKHKLSIARQARLLELSRSTVYYKSAPISESNLALMHRIDELHLEYPFAGSWMLCTMLRLEGIEVGRRRIRQLMKQMGIQALYRRANTSKRNQTHRIYPYLLRGMSITRPNQVWAIDTTYIPMKKGLVYLSAVLDVKYCVKVHQRAIGLQCKSAPPVEVVNL